MNQDVNLSSKSIIGEIRYKVLHYGYLWVIVTQALLCMTVGYYIVADPRSVSPEYFSTLAISATLLLVSCGVFFLNKPARYYDVLLSTYALLISISAILLTHITASAFLSPDDGKKILLILFLIMLMSWNANRVVLATGTLPIVCFYIYLTSIRPNVIMLDILISAMKFPILSMAFYSMSNKFFELFESKFIENFNQIHRLERVSYVDELTRIKNRKGFNSALRIAIDSARRSKSTLAIVILDIDFFKQYNDTKGHPAGDLCLRNVAAILRSQCKRKIDSVCRIGGEEFALIMPATSAHQAASVVDNIRTALAKTAIEHPKSSISKHVTVSIGIAEFGDKDDFESLYQRADKAMYKAKVAGRNQYIVCLEECAYCHSNSGVKTV
ncbi:GGDEF domain-containing protein [Vibrio sp. THAF190c]|uniref:GGDEF domain-containing protein n=1 Tax=Vibrio sp. THAF190c TaxID=2587865 RepID=UPI001268B784|nr:GGDEF domain-containing protein [Vibrio sp. THAF190c]QFT13493.1 Phytochrome-like protein cph2 [Vibrio sp. THAF190c]